MRKSLTIAVSLAVLVLAPEAWARDWTSLYSSGNLSGHIVNPECNPGGGSSCPCSAADVAISFSPEYATVTANKDAAHTWVNAIGGKKWLNTFDSGQPIAPGVFRYRVKARLSSLPSDNLTQQENPQTVQFLVQYFDALNQTITTNKESIEGTIYWNLDSWNDTDLGRVRVYTPPIALTDTGITITPDTEWHTFESVMDFERQEWISVTVDGQTADLSGLGLVLRNHSDWGDDLALTVTHEACPKWPGANCSFVFTYAADFKDAELAYMSSQDYWTTSINALDSVGAAILCGLLLLFALRRVKRRRP